jgi:hypothetical protein
VVPPAGTIGQLQSGLPSTEWDRRAPGAAPARTVEGGIGGVLNRGWGSGTIRIPNGLRRRERLIGDEVVGLGAQRAGRCRSAPCSRYRSRRDAEVLSTLSARSGGTIGARLVVRMRQRHSALGPIAMTITAALRPGAAMGAACFRRSHLPSSRRYVQEWSGVNHLGCGAAIAMKPFRGNA